MTDLLSVAWLKGGGGGGGGRGKKGLEGTS